MAHTIKDNIALVGLQFQLPGIGFVLDTIGGAATVRAEAVVIRHLGNRNVVSVAVPIRLKRGWLRGSRLPGNEANKTHQQHKPSTCQMPHNPSFRRTVARKGGGYQGKWKCLAPWRDALRRVRRLCGDRRAATTERGPPANSPCNYVGI